MTNLVAIVVDQGSWGTPKRGERLAQQGGIMQPCASFLSTDLARHIVMPPKGWRLEARACTLMPDQQVRKSSVSFMHALPAMGFLLGLCLPPQTVPNEAAPPGFAPAARSRQATL